MDTNPVTIGRQNRSEAPVKLADEYYSIISVDKLPGGKPIRYPHQTPVPWWYRLTSKKVNHINQDELILSQFLYS